MNPERVDLRQRGAYYTPAIIADYMASWVLRHRPKSVLEPSAGDGAFLGSIERVATQAGTSVPSIVAIELSREAIDSAKANVRSSRTRFEHLDFMEYRAAKHDAVIGNPPFVRLRHLPPHERAVAVARAEQILNQPMDPAGSTWMPFLLHATTSLRARGCLALVLPLDVTFVRYARPLWAFLSKSFGALRLVRVKERLFPGLSQDVVIFFADEAGASTSTVRFEAFDSVLNLQRDDATVRKDVAVAEVVLGDRAFLRALLQPQLTDLLENRLHAELVSAGQCVRFRIGYVAGDKEFFHPTRERVREYGLRRNSLVPAISSARSLRQAGLHTSGISDVRKERLFLPRATAFEKGEASYIRYGEKSGVAAGYKCRIRSPWFIVPYVAPPDIVLSVFSDKPILALNDASLAVSNSFLCGTVLKGDASTLACRWYNSLTLLECELNVHALGGGVFVMVPREAASVRILRNVKASQRLIHQIDSALKSGNVSQAYQCGDDAMLKSAVGISRNEVDLIREGVETLRGWRNPPAATDRKLFEEVDEELTLLEA